MSEANQQSETVPGNVVSDVVNVTASVQQVTANTVNLSNGGAGVVKGDHVTVSVKQGGVGAVQAGRADISVTEGGIGAVMAQELKLNNTVVSVAIAGRISGESKIMFDMRAGLIAGLVIGAVIAAIKALTMLRKAPCKCA